MKKLLILTTVLPAVFLSGTCFGVDSTVDSTEENKIFHTLTAGGSIRFFKLAYAIGYQYTDSIEISAGPVFSFSSLAGEETRIGILTGLRYHHNIEDISIAPYISANLGVLSSSFSNYNLAYRISSGIDLSAHSQTSLSIGYYLEKGLSRRGYLHGPEVKIRFNF